MFRGAATTDMHVVSVLLLVLFMFRGGRQQLTCTLSVFMLVLLMFRGAATTDMHVVSVLLLVLFMFRGRQQLTCMLSVFVVGSVHV